LVVVVLPFVPVTAITEFARAATQFELADDVDPREENCAQSGSRIEPDLRPPFDK